MFWLVLSAMMVLLATGTAVAYALGASSVLAFIASDNLRYLAIMPQRIFSQIDVFSLMAMPLFILAGEIMNRAGITRALVDFAMAMLGRLKGGLGHVNVLASVFFAGISGSAVADAAALGNTLVPAMVARGYSPMYASALTAAASVIGPIIPPSIVMIFYGAVMQTSVAALFVAGVVPGLMLAGVLFAANAWFARRDNHPGGRAEDVPAFWPALWRALPALSLPLIIMGGIVFGIVTPTEAAALTVVAALAVGAWYGGLGKGALTESLVQTAALTGAIFMILSAVACFGWLAGHEQLPTRLAAFVTEMGLGRVEDLIVINLIFVAAGMFLDPPVALALLVPLLAPPAVALGVDPVHLGIVLCLNLTIGLITPPVGGCLLTVSTVCKVEYWALARAILPFAVLEALLLLLLVLVPEFSLFLPRWFGLLK